MKCHEHNLENKNPGVHNKLKSSNQSSGLPFKSIPPHKPQSLSISFPFSLSTYLLYNESPLLNFGFLEDRGYGWFVSTSSVPSKVPAIVALIVHWVNESSLQKKKEIKETGFYQMCSLVHVLPSEIISKKWNVSSVHWHITVFFQHVSFSFLSTPLFLAICDIW